VLLNCSRGAGKSRVTSALALHTALFRRRSLVLLVSRSLRQATELFRYVKLGFAAVGRPLPALKKEWTVQDLDSLIEAATKIRTVVWPASVTEPLKSRLAARRVP
jgi:phage terminase large subunit-like protein